MRKVFSLTLFALLMLASALLLVSVGSPDVAAFQGPQMGPGGGPGPGHAFGRGGRGGDRGAMGPGFFRRLADRLELSDQQLEQIEALFSENREAHAPLREELRGLHEQLRDLTADGAFFQNEVQVTETAQAIAQLEAQATVDRARLLARIYEVLTPEQREELKDLRDLFKGPRGRRGPRGDRG